MPLYILLGIVGLVVLIFLESFSLSLFGLSILFVLFLFLYKIIGLRTLLIGSFVVTLFFDVVLNIPLGSTFLVFLFSLFFYYLLSSFLSTESGFFSYIFKMLTLLVFNIAHFYIQRVFTFGNLGYFDINIMTSSLFKSLAGLVILILLDQIVLRLRGKQKGGALKFK